MQPRKPVKRSLIVDVGTGDAAFAETLKQRYPKKRVLSIDCDKNSKARLKMGMGEFFRRLKKPERVSEIWLNHVDIHTWTGFKEFQVLAKRILPGTRLFLTIRAVNLQQIANSLESTGFEIKSLQPFAGGMISSTSTKEFEEGAKKGKALMKPVRIFAVKK